MKHSAKVLAALKGHIGVGNGMRVDALARQCGILERDVRHAVSDLRMEGIGVCAHPTTGYFIAANDEELQRYCIKFLEDRAMHSLMVASRLKRLALPEYIGQLKLKT